MSGFSARSGFRYQDLYLLYRVLRNASNSLEDAWANGATDVLGILDRNSVLYGIEAPRRAASPSGAPDTADRDWDVLVLAKEKLEFAEVKSGAVSKQDRLAFWSRLRRELSKAADSKVEIVPILVVDPNTSGELEKWNQLASFASAFTGAPPSAEPANNVLTVGHLLDEALWSLCEPDVSADQSDPAVDPSVARLALASFELHTHIAQELESQVLQLIELIFPGGLADTEQKLLLGWLSKRATDPIPARRFFPIKVMLTEIGILQAAVSLAPEALKDWHDLWTGVPKGVMGRTRLRLGETGDSLAPMQVQPTAIEVLTSGRTRCVVVAGAGGQGKSTFLAQAAHQAEEIGDAVLRCGADDVSIDELETLIKAFRFRAALMKAKGSGQRIWILVDGLDEADVPLRKRWAQLLVRLTNVPNASLVVSVRQAVWNGDSDLRAKLSTWTFVPLALWPEKVVRGQLSKTPYHDALPQSVIELLRTPILLDLFWQTFVESGPPDVSLAARLRTRHNLLSVYWEKRLIGSPRYASVRELSARLSNFSSRAAKQVGSFSDSNEDVELVQLLLSEGVLIREGRLQPRLRFRHPLLRDFAYGQWCLATAGVAEAARRWNSITGGLQRYGTLRAIFEGLSDWNATAEYPQLELGQVVQAIAQIEPSLAGQVAHVLGTHGALRSLDPASWSLAVQASLPSQFGRELLAAARMSSNGTWATLVEHWADDARWLDEGFPKELWQYASVLQQTLKSASKNSELCEQCRQATRKLRRVSEEARFAPEFAQYDRWLKMQSMLVVIPVLPDEMTLAWVEREMAQASWRTRSQVLEVLANLVPVDPNRVVSVYRRAIGVAKNGEQQVLAAPFVGGVMDHQVIEWSLAGEDNRRGLLKEYPKEFLPVAVDLAEAFWHCQQEKRSAGANTISDYIRQLDPSWSQEAEAREERRRLDLLGGLIDDAPEYSYWRSLPDRDLHERCLRAIHECAARCAESGPEDFAAHIYPILRSSRLASVQSILLDLFLNQSKRPDFVRCAVELISDERLYHVSGIEYWLEQGLVLCWPSASPHQRLKILDIIKRLLTSPGEEHNAKNFLLRIPATDLPEDLRPERPAQGDPHHEPYPRPVHTGVGFQGVPIPEDDVRIMGSWPQDFDRDALLEFVRATKGLAAQQAATDDKTSRLRAAVKPALTFARLVQGRRDLLLQPDHLWVWSEFARLLERFRHSQEAKNSPPVELVVICTEIALFVLREVPSEISGDLSESDLLHFDETPWTRALELADAALTWLPSCEDEVIQRDFTAIIEAAFTTSNPVVQMVCTRTIRPWHWFRSAERRQMHDHLIWHLPTHASVLAVSLERTNRYPDEERTRVFRLLLNRGDVQPADRLAHWLGHYVGVGSMVVYDTGNRSTAAELARETIEMPDHFILLRDPTNRQEFLRQLVFGMKEQAALMWSHAELAADYGDWGLKIWRILREHRRRRNESEGVILLLMHWLERADQQNRERATLKKWWDRLSPLFDAVITEGGRPDCFTLFFGLHDGKYNDLTTPEELLHIGEVFNTRIQKSFQEGLVDLDAIDRDQQDWHSWREIVEFLAETIGSLHRDGSLSTDALLERAHQLLAAMAETPLQSAKALELLHRLRDA
jgi:hypothetical protein